MGTRSLLGVETKRGTVHTQYMQFDGYPSVKGYDYYMAVISTLMTMDEETYVTKKGTPKPFFRERCLNFLNDYQYASGHSIGNNFEVKTSDWHKQDCWQEWQYLFRMCGDFDFLNTYGTGYSICTIPWEVTRAIASAFDIYDVKKVNEETDIFRTYFEAMDETSKSCVLSVEKGEIHAFPEQNERGWRNFGVIRVKVSGKIVGKLESMFAKKGKKRNIEKFEVKGVQ